MRCTFRLFATCVVLSSLIACLDTPPACATVFPSSGGVQSVNVIRRYDNALPLYSITEVLGGGQATGGPIANVVDGGHTGVQWNSVTNASTVSMRITLDQVYPLRRFTQTYESGGNYLPDSYDISVSTTGFGALTSVASGGVPAATQTNTLGSFVNAQYIQFTWTGNNTNPNIILREFQAFADSSAALNSNGGWNASRLPVTVTNASVLPGGWIDTVGNIADGVLQDASYLRGNSGAGNARVVMDLGSPHLIESIGLGFYNGQAWGSGMSIELSNDNITYLPASYDTNLSVGQSHVNIADRVARYVRVTDKNSSNGALSEFEVFTDALPTLASTPTSGSTINLGVGMQGTPITLTDAITLQNVGEATSELQVLSFTITGPDAAIFSVPDFAVTTLTVGGVDSVMFNLLANLGPAPDTYFALLTIQTNAGDVMFNLQAASMPAPEPSTLALLGIGLAGLAVKKRRRRQIA